MKDFKIIFVHGYTASHLADWYPEISKELDKLGIGYEIPDLPGGENPHADEWLNVLHELISKIRKPLVLVGHSLGTRAVLLYLEKYKPKVKKVFLIAPFNNSVVNAKRRDECYSDFFDHKIDLKKIKPFVGKFVLVHSKDDDSIKYEQGVELSKDLNSELITFEDRKHFSAPSNAPYILNILKKELNF